MVFPRAGRLPPIGEVVIDRRPLWRIVLEQSRRPALLALGCVIYFYTVWMMPTPVGLSLAGQRALGVFFVCILFWVFNVLPLMVTSLLAIVLLPASGAMSRSEVYGLFGNEALFFILGAFILSAALMHCGLTTRIALTILRRFGHTPQTLLLSIYLLNALLSCVMSEHAVAAMTFPIITEIATVLRLPRRRSNYGRALFLAMAWGTTIGGIATLLGGARAPLAIGILRESTGQTFGFSQWTLAAWPVVAAVLGMGYLVITRFFPAEIDSVREADAVIAEKALRLGRVSTDEKAIGAVMLVTLLAWIFTGERYGLATIALGAVVLLFVFGLVRWRDLEGYVNWGILLMYGGAISLGTALNASGAASWLAASTLNRVAHSDTAIVLVLSGVTILLTEAMSNSAVVALLMPVTLGLADRSGLDPAVMVPAVAVPAGLAFMMPMGTPANAMAYSSGYLSVRDLLVPAGILVVASWATFNLVANWYWPLIGLSLSG
jgi:sodium-dependent dicarboxylate transporter 2/3/5